MLSMINYSTHGVTFFSGALNKSLTNRSVVSCLTLNVNESMELRVRIARILEIRFACLC